MASSAQVGATIAKLQWAVMPLLCAMIACCFVDRSNVAYMQLQLRRPPPQGMSFSPSFYGNASGLFFLGYAACQVPSNLIVARVGAPAWLAVIVTLWGVTAAALAAVRGPAAFLVLRVLLGVFEAGTFPGMWYHMTLFFPPSHITLPLSLTTSAIMLSQVISAPVAAALMALDGALGLRGWQWLAVAEGSTTVAVGILLKLSLPKSAGDVRSLSADEVAWVHMHAAKPPTAAEVLAGLRYASTSRTLWHLTAALSAKCLAATALIFWTPLVISDLISRGGWAEGASSAEHNRAAMLLTAVPYTLAAAASYAIGRSSHAWDDRKVHTCVLFTAGAAVLLAAPFLQGQAMAVPAFAALCAALCACSNTGLITSMLVACMPRAAQPGGLALYNSVSIACGYLGSAGFGWLKEATGGNSAGMAVMGAVLAAGGLLLAAFDERAAAAEAPQMMPTTICRGGVGAEAAAADGVPLLPVRAQLTSEATASMRELDASPLDKDDIQMTGKSGGSGASCSSCSSAAAALSELEGYS